MNHKIIHLLFEAVFEAVSKSIFTACWYLHLSMYSIKEANEIESESDRSFRIMIKEKFRHAVCNNTEMSLFNETIKN